MRAAAARKASSCNDPSIIAPLAGHLTAHPCQAVRDATESAEAQAGWLREALPRQFTEKLLKQVGLCFITTPQLCTLLAALLACPYPLWRMFC